MKKKVIKYFLIVLMSILLLGFVIISGILVYYNMTSNFEMDKINNLSFNIKVYDDKENVVKEKNSPISTYVSLESLPNYIPQTFLAVEDKNFYKHNGIDYKRIIKANLVNLKHFKFKQGGSTISQQLIKNTHLTSQRTLSRKFKEIAITKKMEKVMKKNKILETYLNIIYFGNNCYGIENASNYYFSKHTKDLTQAETAMLVGLISAPNYYSPTKNLEKCTSKRNVVLKVLLNSKLISQNDYDKLITQPIQLNITNKSNNSLNTYSQSAIDEACNILNITEKQLALEGYNIYTYLDSNLQNQMIQSVENANLEKDYACIKIDSNNGAITNYFGNSAYKINDCKRQPGSTIKPILVYSPALELNKITPNTPILDESINLNGYQPQNHDKKYHGYITVNEAVEKSYNIPAIKCMSYSGIEQSKYYAKKCDLQFDKQDDSSVIALGGMKYGIEFKNLVGSYTSLSQQGYTKPTFIKYITNSKNQIVYLHKPIHKQVFRDDTRYLMTEMLKNTTKFGTAKLLKDIDYDIASKTGTVGNKDGNSDAYNVSYTTQDVFGVWIGDLTNNKKSSITGGKEPTKIMKTILDKTYKNNKPTQFERPASVVEVEIDLISLEKEHNVKKANNFIPERYKQKMLFSIFNLPEEVSENFTNIKPVEVKYNKKEKTVEFEAKDFEEYIVYSNVDGVEKEIKSIKNKSGKQSIKVPGDNQIIYVITKVKNYANETEIVSVKSNEIKLMFNNEVLKKPIKDDKWFLAFRNVGW